MRISNTFTILSPQLAGEAKPKLTSNPCYTSIYLHRYIFDTSIKDNIINKSLSISPNMMRHTMKLLGQQARRIQPSNIAPPISIRHAGTLVSPLRNNNPLLLRIATALDQKTPVVQALEQWREQGNQVKPSDLRCIIKKLQDSEHFSHALQVLKPNTTLPSFIFKLYSNYHINYISLFGC